MKINEELQEQVDEYKGLYATMYRKWSELDTKDLNKEYVTRLAHEYMDKNIELQKQLLDMEAQRDNQAYIAEELVQEKHRWTEQAVKDAEKEILTILLKEFSLRKSCEDACDFVRILATVRGVEVK